MIRSQVFSVLLILVFPKYFLQRQNIFRVHKKSRTEANAWPTPCFFSSRPLGGSGALPVFHFPEIIKRLPGARWKVDVLQRVKPIRGEYSFFEIVYLVLSLVREQVVFNGHTCPLTRSQSRSPRSLFCHRPSDGLQAAGQLRRARLPRPRWPALWSQLPGEKRRSGRWAAASPLGHHAAGYPR